MKTSEDEEAKYIPVKWIEHYTVCPVRIYFMGVLRLNERRTDYMQEGKEEQAMLEQKDKRRETLLARRKEKVMSKWYDVSMVSDKLHLVGQADMILVTEMGLKVAEIKDVYSLRLLSSHIYQVAAYGMMAEEKFHLECMRLIIYYVKSDKVFEVPLTQALRSHVAFIVSRIRRIIYSERIPPYREKSVCKSCGFRYVCEV
jgi:CRISPR-associated protein Cas4